MGLPQYKSKDGTIRSLPQNVLERVFAFLTVDDVKTLRQVCSDFDAMIFQATYQRFFQTIKKRDDTITDAALYHREAALNDEDAEDMVRMVALAYTARISPCIKNIVLDVDEDIFGRRYIPLYNLLSRTQSVQTLDLRFLKDIWSGPQVDQDGTHRIMHRIMVQTGSAKFFHWLGLSEPNAPDNPMRCYPLIHLPALKRLCIARAAINPVHLANVTKKFINTLEHLELDEVYFIDPDGRHRMAEARWYLFLKPLADQQRDGGAKLREVSFRDRSTSPGDFVLHHLHGNWCWSDGGSFSRFCYSGPDMAGTLDWLLHTMVHWWYKWMDGSSEDLGIDGVEHMFQQPPNWIPEGTYVWDDMGEEEWDGFEEFEMEELPLNEIIQARYSTMGATAES
ncbi:hypothetical protein GGR57DRAFT_502003 [Xylariaceae sp. FL1272]|nr:hypothetical protein GGR57DRAFT_502003 [Xylariaceae sp. FL1272]